MKENTLRKYYYERLHIDEMPRFHKLTEVQKKEIRRSMGFAMFEINYDFAQIVDEFYRVCKTLKIIN